MAISLAEVLPASRYSTDRDVLAGYLTDQEQGPSGQPAALVRPASTEEVAAVVAWAHRERVPVVPRGAGTGLTGGCNAVAGGIVLSLERMNQIQEINTVERYAVVQPGVINQELRTAAAGHGLWYPPDPSSKDLSSLGGNVATNAGGLCCVKYGVTKDYVLALEVVTGTGQVLRLGRRTAKGVVGLDLAALFVGSEGCLGVVTQATLRLRTPPAPAGTVVGLFAGIVEGAEATAAVRAAGVQPEVCELMDGAALDAVQKLMPLGLPEAGRCLVLLQVAGEAAAAAAGAALERAGAVWACRSESPDEAELLFTARRRAFEAVSRLGAVTTEDICVPIGAIGSAVAEITELGERLGVPIATVAHAGDGNLHPMLVDDGTVARATISAAFVEIMAIALRHGGTVAGEHGVGLLKREMGIRELGEPVVALSSRIKSVFDPAWIMNPGKGALVPPAGPGPEGHR